jgi:type IX secretion system PorP/SprF family membrane protein
MMKGVYLVLALFFLLPRLGISQQRNLTQFYNSSIFNNPSESGAIHSTRFSANYRKQWPTIASGYQTSVFALDAQVKKFGYGVVFATNEAGPSSLKTSNFLFNLSHQIKLNSFNTLRFGYQIGLNQYSLNTSNYKFESQYDLENGFNSSTSNGENFNGSSVVDITGGVGFTWQNNRYQWKPKVSMGLYNFVHSKKSIFLNTGSNAMKLFSGSLQVEKKISDRYTFIPYMFYSYQQNASNLLYGSNFKYHVDTNKQLQFGVGFRNKDALLTYVGIEFHNALVGFSYDINTSKLVEGTSSIGAYELSAIFTIQPPKKKQAPITIHRVDTIRIEVPVDKDKSDTMIIYREKGEDGPIDISTIDNYWKYNHYYVYFNFDESKVLPKYQFILDGLIEDLKKFPDHKLLIHGHTDSDGESIYNIYLGEARANEVMKYLVDRGVSHGKIRTFTYGQTNPAEPNTSIDKKAKNRRVEIILLTK